MPKIYEYINEKGVPDGGAPGQVIGKDPMGNKVWMDPPESGESNDYNHPDFPTMQNYNDALNHLLYKPPEVTSFTLSTNQAEKGQEINNLTLSWQFNKNTITSQSINHGIGALADLNLRSFPISGANITATRTYTITVSDGVNIATKDAVIRFLDRVHFGVSPQTNLTTADVLMLGGNELSINRQQTRIFNASPNGGNYLYFAWPSVFGTPTFLIGGLVNSAWIKETISHTNQHGYTVNYDIWRSQYKQNGTAITVEVK